MQNRFSHIRLVVTKAETAFAELLVLTCEFVSGETISHHFRVNPLITFSANSNQYFQRYGQAVARIGVVNNQQKGQQQDQQNSNRNSYREK